MTDEELKRLAQLTAARLTPAAELMMEVGEDLKTVAARLPAEKLDSIAERLDGIETRLPPPRPERRWWNPARWLLAPVPRWWTKKAITWIDRAAWFSLKTLAAITIAGVIAGALWTGFDLLAKPFLVQRMDVDGQWWVGIRLTWWLPDPPPRPMPGSLDP